MYYSMDEYDVSFYRKLYYLGASFLYFLVRGKATASVSNPTRVVIIQGAQMGDMVCTTPMFRAIKKQYPNAKLTVIGNKVNKETLAGNPDVDNYLVWTERIAELIPQVRALKADFGCVTSPNFPGLALLYLAGVKTIAVPKIENGWSPYETKPYKLLRFVAVQKPHRMRHYAPGEYLKLLEPLGIHTIDTTKFVYTTEAGDKAAREKASRLKDVAFTFVILPGAGNTIKVWPTEHFVEVADYVMEKYNAGLFICGTNATRSEADLLLKKVKRKDKIVDLTGQMGIDETKAFYKYVDLVVAVDTGPMFFAEAHGTPTVDIAGNIDENEQAPNDGKTHLVVVPPNRGTPEVLTMNARAINFERATEQIRSVTVKMVTDVIDTIVPRLSPGRNFK